MSTAPAIVFDLGKVLVDFDYGITARRLAAQCKMNEGEIRQLIDQSPLLYRYETGELSTEKFFHAVSSATGFNGSLEEFCLIFGDIFAAIDPMIELHARLRTAGVPVFIFSNTNELAIRHIRKHFPFFAGFDDFIFSFEHGAMKPDARLYEVVERRTARRGTELIYIDDRAENIAAAKPRGWQTVLHKTPEKTRVELRALGVNC